MRRPSVLLILAALAALPARAQEPPACTAERAGLAACIAGKLCRCDFARGGSLSGRPDGWRWDCGTLRPDCGAPPASPWPGAMPLPPPDILLQLPPPPATLSRPGR